MALSGSRITIVGNEIPPIVIPPPPPLPVTSGLIGRWDASTLSFADAATVTSWPDESGNGRHMTPVGTGPTARTSIQNGLRVVRFNGSTSEVLRAAGATVIPKHVFAVAKATATTFPSFSGLLTGTGAANDQILLIGNQGSGAWYNGGGAPTYHRDSVADASLTGPMNRWVVMSMSNPTLWTSLVQFQIGDDRNVGNRYWLGDVGEIVAYDRVLSDAERLEVETYLAAKWGTFPVLPGLTRWYKADDAGTITSSATLVSQWNDKAGGDENLTQATSGNRPRTGTRTMNGRNVLDFDGGDWLGASTNLPLPLTTFVVAQSDIATTAIHRFLLAGVGNACAIEIDTSEAIYLYTGSGWTYWTTPLDANPHIYAFTLDSVGSAVRLDGVQQAAGIAGSFGSLNLTVGGATDGTSCWDGIVAEVIQYNRVLTATEIARVEAYLRSEWGTP